jgi:hypothetical protein
MESVAVLQFIQPVLKASGALNTQFMTDICFTVTDVYPRGFQSVYVITGSPDRHKIIPDAVAPENRDLCNSTCGTLWIKTSQ